MVQKRGRISIYIEDPYAKPIANIQVFAVDGPSRARVQLRR